MDVSSISDWIPTLAALLHFVQLPAMIKARHVLDWDGEMSRLAPINRWIVRVIGGGIMLCILGLGLVVISAHGRLLDSACGAALCVFLAVFWGYRGLVQWLVYSRLWPPGERWSHYALEALFAVLVTAYGAAAASVYSNHSSASDVACHAPAAEAAEAADGREPLVPAPRKGRGSSL